MAAPSYPAAVATTSATALSGITQSATGPTGSQITLPVIVASGAVAGQALVGDFVYLQTPELAGAQVVDANTGQVFTAMGLFQTAFFLASANGVWKQVAALVPVCLKVIPKGAVNTLAFGAANAAAAIVTPGSVAGFIPVVGPGGQIGFVPFWM